MNLKPDFEQKKGLSPGYCRAEGKYVIKQMLFSIPYTCTIFFYKKRHFGCRLAKNSEQSYF
jgi:hypothetical protein